MKCNRCGRALKNPSPSGFGPVCLRAVTGAKPARVRLFDRRPAGKDERQVELFGEVRQ